MASPTDWRDDAAGCVARQHGTANAYRNHRCRCPGTAQLVTRRKKLLAAGLVPPSWVGNVGVIRRRQALGAIGYSLADLAPHFGVTASALNCHVIEGRTVHRSTYEQWRRVYDLLAMTPGSNTRARREGQRRGWAPPLAWDDESIDDPAAKPNLGSRRARDRASLAEEARFLLGFRIPLAVVAKRLDVTEAWLKQLLGNGARAAA